MDNDFNERYARRAILFVTNISTNRNLYIKQTSGVRIKSARINYTIATIRRIAKRVASFYRISRSNLRLKDIPIRISLTPFLPPARCIARCIGDAAASLMLARRVNRVLLIALVALERCGLSTNWISNINTGTRGIPH